MESLRNFGFGILNNREAPEETTIIVTGLPRSGTSMVGSVLQTLGVFIGDRTDAAVFEDVRLANALENKGGESPFDVAADYNSRHAMWAFKRPSAYKYILRYSQVFRNPRFVVTYRDPVAIAKRNQISMGSKFKRALRNAETESRELTAFVLATEFPTLLLSYEKSVAHPAKFVNALKRFTGLECAPSAQEKAVMRVNNGPNLYLRASQTRFPKNGSPK